MTATEPSYPSSQTPFLSASPPKKRALFRILVPVLILLVVGFGVWKLFFSRPTVPDNIVALSGRIEGDDSAVAPKRAGASSKCACAKATPSRPATSSRFSTMSRCARARSRLARAAQRQSASAGQSAQAADRRPPGAICSRTQLQTGQSKVDAEGRVRQAEAELAAAEAELAQQQAALQLALFDKDAYTSLPKSGAVSERQGKQAEATAEPGSAAVAAAAKRRVERCARRAERRRRPISPIQASARRNPAPFANRLLQQQSQIASARPMPLGSSRAAGGGRGQSAGPHRPCALRRHRC